MVTADRIGERMKKDIIIFGAGKIGEKFIYQYFDKVDIDCIWDNKKEGEFLGYQIKKPSARKNCFIIVATGFYMEIREQLICMGYREFDDFIPYEIFRKKIAVTYGNCHMAAVQAYLERHKAFSLEYGFYPFPPIYEIKNFKNDYYGILRRCELFIHQSVRKNNVYGEEYSSESILRHLNKKCEVIAIPNLYGRSKYLFPQLITGKDWQVGSFCPYFIDRNIALWIKEGRRIEEIKKYIFIGGVYKKKEIIDLWEHFVQEIEIREQEWNIKILDYILSNQREKKIFCDINHITSETAHEIANRLLSHMNYDKQDFFEIPMMDDLEAFVYADVKEALELEFEERRIRKWGKTNCLQICEMNEDAYIEQLYQFTKFCINLKNVKEN